MPPATPPTTTTRMCGSLSDSMTDLLRLFRPYPRGHLNSTEVCTLVQPSPKQAQHGRYVVCSSYIPMRRITKSPHIETNKERRPLPGLLTVDYFTTSPGRILAPITSVSNLLVHDTAERQAALRGHNDEKATENLGLPLEARGGMVEMGGIEPPSNGRPRILLRAQSTVLFLSPQHCVDSPPDRLS